MKTRYKVLILVLLAAGSFLAGSWVTYQGGRGKATAERKILHYVDPMNPAFKSDKPGIAPCGMPLEPVYADQGDAAAGGAGSLASLPPGTIRISPEKQQLIGVKTAIVEKVPWSYSVRVLGRVTADETRVYRINAAIGGWIQAVSPVTTGSLVKKDDLLATFYSLEHRTLLTAFINWVRARMSQPQANTTSDPQARLSTAQSKQFKDAVKGVGTVVESSQFDYLKMSLLNVGISEYQIQEIERTGTYTESIDIRAPAAGFILIRNVSPGFRFDRGAEFFRIADLSRVWILADVFENEVSSFKPGMRVKMELPYQKRILYAEVSNVLPQFDPASRTLKVRLAAENPGYAMRPDMFVNVELPLNGPPAIIVPVDAVLDSGLKKTIFVDRGNGFLEPRQVETGRSLGERVEIVRGLMPNEKIVVSGNFLLDSEARMQHSATGITGKIGRDPVCGMNIDEDRARAEGNFLEYRGQTYFFCDPKDREDFRKEPGRYLKSAPAQGKMPMPKPEQDEAKLPSRGAMEMSGPHDAKKTVESPEGMPMAMPKETAPMAGSRSGGTPPPFTGAAGMNRQPMDATDSGHGHD